MKIPKSLLKQRMRAQRRRFFLFSPKPGLAIQVSEGTNGYEIDRNSRSCGVEKKELALSSVSLELTY